MSDQTISIGGMEISVRLEKQGSVTRVASGERSVSIEILGVGETGAVLRVDGRQVIVPFVLEGGTVHFVLDGVTWRAEIAGRRGGRRGRHAEHSLSAPMPGVVLKISVKPGDVVRRGAALLVLEAMKMEHQISAPHDGRVGVIHCREGELVQPGVDLIELIATDEKENETATETETKSAR